MQGGHGVVGVVWSHWFGAALEGQNFLPRCAGHGCSGHGGSAPDAAAAERICTLVPSPVAHGPPREIIECTCAGGCSHVMLGKKNVIPWSKDANCSVKIAPIFARIRDDSLQFASF